MVFSLGVNDCRLVLRTHQRNGNSADNRRHRSNDVGCLDAQAGGYQCRSE